MKLCLGNPDVIFPYIADDLVIFIIRDKLKPLGESFLFKFLNDHIVESEAADINRLFISGGEKARRTWSRVSNSVIGIPNNSQSIIVDMDHPHR